MVCVALAKARFYRDSVRDESQIDEGAWAAFAADEGTADRNISVALVHKVLLR